MSLTEKMEVYLKERRGEKSEKVRKKNSESGKDCTKGWGKMVNTGFGGLNSMNHAHDTVTSWQHEIDNKAFIAEEQRRIARENTKK